MNADEAKKFAKHAASDGQYDQAYVVIVGDRVVKNRGDCTGTGWQQQCNVLYVKGPDPDTDDLSEERMNPEWSIWMEHADGGWSRLSIPTFSVEGKALTELTEYRRLMPNLKFEVRTRMVSDWKIGKRQI